MTDHWLLLTETALFRLTTSSRLWEHFCDVPCSDKLNTKIKRIGLKYKTKALVEHDRLLDGRDYIEELQSFTS